MDATYWNGIGKYQEQYDRMAEDLVPDSGNCETVAGELMRSVSRLGYDFYNNGMGNNTSGAANFLLEKGAIDDDTYRTIYDFTRGRVYNGNYHGDSLQIAIEHAVDMTIEFILNNPQLITMENSEDMFDYQDDDQHFCEECGDEVDTRCGWICSYCEEAMEEEYDDEEEWA
jgi:hypothetical protein